MDGFSSAKLSYFWRIWELRYFWFSLVRNDLDNRYKRSFFGIGWSLLKPLAMTTVLCVVFGKLLNVAVEEYAPYLLLGTTTWQFFTESLLMGCNSLSLGSAYIRQQQVPLAIFPLRTVLAAGFHFLVALSVGIIVALYFKGGVNPLALLSLIPALVVLFLLGWALAIISGVVYTHFPDTNQLLEISLQVLFYMTPILIPPKEIIGRGGRLALLVEWNPFTSILALIRTPILEGTLPQLDNIVISLSFLAVVGGLAIVLLRKLERTLVFWI
jgi:ABC-type polysaccharide/polyol phosphate export permease